MAQLTRTADQPLALSDVQEFFGRSVAGVYPTTGGVAVENLGRQTSTGKETGDTVSWPEGTPEFFGVSGFTYQATASSDGILGTTGGTITNGTGSNIPISIDNFIDIVITIHSVSGDGVIPFLQIFQSGFESATFFTSNVCLLYTSPSPRDS